MCFAFSSSPAPFTNRARSTVSPVQNPQPGFLVDPHLEVSSLQLSHVA
jgi:hypothetical protein